MRLINLGVSGSSLTLISHQTSFPAAHPMLLGVERTHLPAHSPPQTPMEAHPSDVALVRKREAPQQH